MPEQWPGDSPQAWIDDIGHAIAERYRRIEDALRETLERLIEQHLDVPDDTLVRYRAIQSLREQAELLVKQVDPEQMARWATAEAAHGASAEIARQLLDFPAYAAMGAAKVTALTAAGAYAVAAVELDLRDSLRALNARILRAPVDAYQAMTSRHVGSLLAGMTTSRALHRRILDEYLADGITGFIDKSDRRWTIGAYSEMATRSAAARAWRDQSVASMEAAGITTFTPVIGSSACSKCAAWQGKIVTDGGQTGDIMVPHAITAVPTPLHIDGTLAEMRASGWGHPNCRCTLAPGLPGGPDPTKYSTHDPQKQADREKLRELERDVRQAKRDGDPDEIGAAQAALRRHVDETGIIRREYREQLPFADGGDANPRGRTVPTGGPEVPDVPGPRVAVSGEYGTSLKAARASIEKVHAFPNAPGPEVRATRLRPGVQGRYMHSLNLVEMSPQATFPRLTFAHEYGHHLDMIAGAGKPASSQLATDPWRKLFSAINASSEHRTLRALRASEKMPAEGKTYITYLLRRNELWARAYAQYIAERSGDRHMLAGVREAVGSSNAVLSSRQWSASSFGQIREAIDEVLREVGWLA